MSINEVKYLCPVCMGDMVRHEKADRKLSKKQAYKCQDCHTIKHF